MKISGVSYLSVALVMLSVSVITGGAVDDVSAADVFPTRWRGNNVLRLSGEIDAGTLQKLKDQAEAAEIWAHGLPILLLDSPGGSVSEALEISNFLDSKPFHTVVPAAARCASACASIVFVAGAMRTVEQLGQLGQHSCSIAGVASQECNELLSYHAVEHGVSFGSIGSFVTNVPPDEILWFTREDADGWGLTRYPGVDESGFEKSEPRVFNQLTGETPPGQQAWRLDFRGDGFEAFFRPISDEEPELELNLFCLENMKGRLFLSMQITGPVEQVKPAVQRVSVEGRKLRWLDDAPVIWQKDDFITEIVTEIPPDLIREFLMKIDEMIFRVSVRSPYEEISVHSKLMNSRKNLIFAANNCAKGNYSYREAEIR